MKIKNLLRQVLVSSLVAVLVVTAGGCKEKEKGKKDSSSAQSVAANVTEDVKKLTVGADVRVMSYNVLHPEWSGTSDYVTIVGRDTNVQSIVNYYKPDVVGLQELCHPWHFSVDKYLIKNGDYAFACASTATQTYNMTTFIYNTKTVKLIEEYVLDLDEGSDIRVLSVAIFEKLSDGKRFVVTNTHPAPVGQADNYKRNFEDLIKLTKIELEKYNTLPVIMAGDFNTREQADTYTWFINETGVKDAKYEADKIERAYSTFIGWPNGIFREGNSSCIDHIFVNNNASVKLFDTVIDHDVEKASDHIPIYADIILK